MFIIKYQEEKFGVYCFQKIFDMRLSTLPSDITARLSESLKMFLID